MEKFLEFGLPILVVIIVFVQLSRSNPGSGGSSGALGALFIAAFWGVFFIGLLVVGVISWVNSSNTAILQAFLFSLIAFFAAILGYNALFRPKKRIVSPEEIEKRIKESDQKKEDKKNEKAQHLQKLNLILEKTPNDLPALEERGLILVNYSEQLESGIQDLEKAVSLGSQKILVYEILYGYCIKSQRFKKAEEYITIVLQKEKNGLLKLEKYQHNLFIKYLEEVKEIIRENENE